MRYRKTYVSIPTDGRAISTYVCSFDVSSRSMGVRCVSVRSTLKLLPFEAETQELIHPTITTCPAATLLELSTTDSKITCQN